MKGRDSFERGVRGLLARHRIESTGEGREFEVSRTLAYCWTMLKASVIFHTGGRASVRVGSALSILRKQANGSWILVRDANLLSAVS